MQLECQAKECCCFHAAEALFKVGPHSLITSSHDTSGHVLPIYLQQLSQNKKWCFYTYWPDFIVGSTVKKGTLLVTLKVRCTVTDNKGRMFVGRIADRKKEWGIPTAEDCRFIDGDHIGGALVFETNSSEFSLRCTVMLNGG